MGGTLTATVFDVDGVPIEGVKYQWMRNGEAIDGATGASYQLTADDAGHKISVKAAYTDGDGHVESPVSSGTNVPKDNPPPTADFHDDFSAYPAGSDFAQGSTFGEWRVIQSGYGHVKVVDDGNGNNVLELKPKVQSGESATSSTEVIGPEHGSDFTFSGTISTPEQLRQGAAPHAWETGWLVWNYTDNDHFYYFVPRANGWELGKRDPAYKGGQRFIASGNESWPLADAKEFSISKHGNTVEIKINGKVVTTITDDSDAYSGNGRVGIYSEDARVHADNISLSKQANIEGKVNHAGSISIQADNTGTLHATINDGDNVDNSKPVSYQWYAGNDAIAGATGADYTPTGQTTGITVRATYTDGNGHVESIVSPLASASNGGSNHPGSVTIEGEAREGNMLTAHVSDADGVDANAIQYTWLRDGNPINFVKGNTYTLTGEDVGHQISVQAYYHDKAGHEENNVISAKTAAVTEADTAAPAGNLHHEAPVALHGDADDTAAQAAPVAHDTATGDAAAAAHPADSDGHHGLHVSDGIDTAAYSGLMNLDGADLLNYLGEHSSELLAASKTASSHALHGGAGDDTLVAGHGAALLEGGAGADTFAYLLDSNDAASWQQPGKILDFNPHEGDRIVLAGDEHLAHAKLEVSEDASGQHLHVTDDAGHTRSIDIASQGGKTLSAEDILSHVDIAAPKAYEPSAYSAPQTHHLPQDDNTHLI